MTKLPFSGNRLTRSKGVSTFTRLLRRDQGRQSGGPAGSPQVNSRRRPEEVGAPAPAAFPVRQRRDDGGPVRVQPPGDFSGNEVRSDGLCDKSLASSRERG